MNRLRPWLFIIGGLLASVAMAESLRSVPPRWWSTTDPRDGKRHLPLVKKNSVGQRRMKTPHTPQHPQPGQWPPLRCGVVGGWGMVRR